MLVRFFTLSQTHPMREAFHRFGIHCATHQIRVIIISCALMCVLLYPAMATHYSSQPLSHFSTKMLDSFLPPNTPATAFRTDVRHVWEGHDIFHVREDAAALARCGTEGTIRVERVIVPTTAPDLSGALNRHTLLAALELQRKISTVLAEVDFTDVASCVRDTKGSCLFLSPLGFWADNDEILMADPHIVRTVNIGRNMTSAGIPLHASTTLAGRASDPHSGKTTHAADFLVLSYFFPEVMCNDNFGHNLWLRGLEHAVSGIGSISHTAYRPQLLALEYQAPDRNRTAVSLAIYVVYAVAIAYLAAPLWRMKSVHSRLGLAFTAFVELLASTVMSISVCVMWGWRVTMVPWAILPVVIVIVGTENMWHLLSALSSTSVTLSVKERVGLAMRQAGTANTMELLAYNTLLGTVASFTVGAIRQFCVFGMVVFVVHWFMIHTFWITVLSIDAQRLELDEVLRQRPDPPMSMPAMSSSDSRQNGFGLDVKHRPKPSKISRILATLLRFLRRHYAINSTLVVFSLLMVGLYFKYPFPSKQSQVRHAISHGILSTSPEQVLPLAMHSESSSLPDVTPAQRFWELINPTNQSLVHVRIETPAIVELRPAPQGGATPYKAYGWPWSFIYGSLRPGLWMIKIMVLPIGATMGLLWGFLWYLLKDADIVEAQRYRLKAEIKTPPRPNYRGLGDGVSFSVLPRILASDVELISSNRDGNVIVSVSVDNEVVCWRLDRKGKCLSQISLVSFLPEGVKELPSVTCVAVDDHGGCCAVGTDIGATFVWMLHSGGAGPLAPFEHNSSAVYALSFNRSPVSSTEHVSGLSPLHLTTDIPERIQRLIVGYDDGSAMEWNVVSREQNIIIDSSTASDAGPALVCDEGLESDFIHVVTLRPDSSIELWRRDPGDSSWSNTCLRLSHPPGDHIVDVRLRTIRIGENYRTIVVGAASAGRISVWDAEDGGLIHSANHIHGTISKLRVANLPSKRCDQCGDSTMDGLIIAVGIDESVRVLRATFPSGAKRCSCLQDYAMVSPALTSSSGSFTDSPTGRLMGLPPSPIRKMLSRSSLINPDYSGSLSLSHGTTSPRSDETEVPRRSTDSISTTEDTTTPPLSPSATGAQFGGISAGPLIPDPPRRSAWPGFRVHALPELTCERGGWDLLGCVVVGVRRTAPGKIGSMNGAGQEEGKSSSVREPDAEGLRSQDLHRWEVWTLDSSDIRPLAHSSEVGQLTQSDGVVTSPKEGSTLASPLTNHQRSKYKPCPRLPFTRVTPVVTTGPAYFAAGFGNAVGMVRFSTAFTTPSSSPGTSFLSRSRRTSHSHFISPRASAEEHRV